MVRRRSAWFNAGPLGMGVEAVVGAVAAGYQTYTREIAVFDTFKSIGKFL